MDGSQTADARAFAIRLATFYGALFVVYGMNVPYMPVWLDWRGLTAPEISAVMAAPFFLRILITPAVALIADRNGSHRTLLIVLAWLSLGLVLALSQAATYWPIMLLTVPLIICNSTIMPLTETVAVAGVRRAGLDYGRMRLWGSLSFVAASFAGGIAVAHYGGGAGVWLVAIGCLLTVAAAHNLPREKYDGAEHTGTQDTVTPLWRAREPGLLLRQPAFIAFLLAAGLIQAAHATFLTFGALIWQKQGLGGAWIGALWAIGVFAEVVVFAMSGALVEKFGTVRLLLAGASASVVRWIAMGFDPDLTVLVPLQLLHGITYGASHVAAIHFIKQAVPRHASGTAQALYATVAAGLAMGIATLIAGWIFSAYGSASYFSMAVVSALALLAAVRLLQIWNGSELAAVTPSIQPT